MSSHDDPLRADVAAAVDGDRAALERVVAAIGPEVHRLALRFFGVPADADDAAQEALIQIVTRLDRFGSRSLFTTWAYRVATNRFLSIARARSGPQASFDDLAEELATQPVGGAAPPPGADEALLAEEVRVGCTLAMLHALDPAQRMAFILGEIMGLDHRTAADVLDISPAAFRKRLQRARDDLAAFMRAECGLFDPGNPCRCEARIPYAMERGRLDPDDLVFAGPSDAVRRYPEVLAEIRRLEEAERAGALFRAHPEVRATAGLADFVARLLGDGGPVTT